MWIIFKEWYNQTFKGLEQPMVDLKKKKNLRILYDLIAALSGHSFSNLLDFFFIVLFLTEL